MATHSPFLSDHLPQAAIRVLYLSNGRVRVSDRHSAQEALHEVDDIPPGKVVLVEDERAKHIILSALQASGPTADKDIRWFASLIETTKASVAMTPRPDLAMLAVQGPEAREKVWRVLPGSEAATAALKPF